jgi:dolichyl-phosphate-mannose--protein O-mannosyl transferase
MSWRLKFWIPATALLVVMGALMVTSALQESSTWDEGLFLAAGYSHLKTGDFRMHLGHPPLARMLCALPLLWLKPDLPRDSPSWAQGNALEFPVPFLYRNRVPADIMLSAGRMVTILMTLLLGLAVALWARAHFGGAAALLALFFLASDPNLLAHGHYITTDLPITLFFFLATAAWARFLVRRSAWDLVRTGVALGLALLTKASAMLLLPLFTLLYLLRAWQTRSRLAVGRFLLSMTVLAGISAFLILAVYRLPAWTHLASAGTPRGGTLLAGQPQPDGAYRLPLGPNLTERLSASATCCRSTRSFSFC